MDENPFVPSTSKTDWNERVRQVPQRTQVHVHNHYHNSVPRSGANGCLMVMLVFGIPFGLLAVLLCPWLLIVFALLAVCSIPFILLTRA